MTNKDRQRLIFDAVLYPHRSLDKRQFKYLMMFIIFACSGLALYFYSKGAWPVMGFFGLEILAVYAMFHFNFKAANHYEAVRLYRRKLVVEDVVNGKIKRWEFDPAWVDISMRQPESGRNNGALNILSRGKGVSIGEFLSDYERVEFKSRLVDAIGSLKASSIARNGLG
jgi:uncharacterized membrane protein